MTAPAGVAYPTQTMYWALDERRPGITNVLLHADWRGPLDTDRLQWAFCRAIARHSALACSLRPREADATLDDGDPAALWTHLRADLVSNPAVEIETTAVPDRRAVRKPIDLSDPPALKVWVEEEHAERCRKVHLLTTHTIFDGWSLHLLARDVSHLYASGDADGAPGSDYLGVVRSQYDEWRSGGWNHHIGSVSDTLRDVPELRLPLMSGKLSIWPLTKGLRFGLAADDAAKLGRAARERRRTPFAMATACLATALHEVFGWEDVVATMVAANRQPSTRDVVGLFANAVFLRLPAGRPLHEQVDATWRSILTAIAKAHVPFPLLRAQSAEVRAALAAQPHLMVRQEDRAGGHLAKASRAAGAARPTPTPVLSAPLPSWPGRPSDPTAVEPAPPAFQFGHDTDLLFDCFFDGEQPSFSFTYRADLLDEETVRELVAAFRGACAAASGDGAGFRSGA